MNNQLNLLSSQSAPYSQEAEEAVIGSVLVNPEAYLTVASFLKAEDFFLLRHSYIWQALQRLNERSEPIDYLTLMQELKDIGKLEEIGGPAYITLLVNNTPTSIYAETYGRLVERAAIRRRLMVAADEIKALAVNEELTIEAVTIEAETRLFTVTDRQLKREFVPMREAINEYFDRIEHLMHNQTDSLGLPTGFRDLDELLGGLQKSDLIIFAGRPGMGKTSFLLSIALNAARIGGRIGIFTMEMGTEQITQRLVSMETGINTQKLRLGQISPQEYSRFVEAAGRIANLRIFIDDTPALNPIQMRTKCRRLAHEHGIDLIILDYVQLMNSGSVYENNRVQEVSYISRALKELARELNVPILSAAQLSRAVEQRQDKRPVLSDLRESGCLAGESLVYLPDDGRYVPIKDLVGQSGFRVMSLNPETWKLEPSVVSNSFSTGVKPVYRLTTRLGRTIRATANHKFVTIDGWKRLDELKIDEHIALPRILESTTKQTMTNSELALLGHLIGDGCTLPTHAIQYTTREDDLAEIVANLATQMFGDEVRPRIHKEVGKGWFQVFLPPTRHLTHGVHSPVRMWLEKLSAYGLRSYEKRVPDKVFQQPKAAIALFLRHLWATDGAVLLRRMKDADYPTIYYATSSRGLANDVTSLLMRLGINAKLCLVPQGVKGRDQYHIVLGGKTDFEQFIFKVGAVGAYKQASLERIKDFLVHRSISSKRDYIPNTAWGRIIDPTMSAKAISKPKLQTKSGLSKSVVIGARALTRENALTIAKVIESESLGFLAESDVYWDAIVSIEPDGETEVYDLTVPGNSNFVANDCIVHNSLEQDTDVVMFLYRDSVYNEATEFPNQADVIIAKHRNGPTGTISLYFDRTVTKFMDGAVRRVDLGEMK